MPMVSHFSGENVEGDGVLWQRWQFSAHNCAPDLAATFWLTLQLYIDVNATVEASSTVAISEIFFNDIPFIQFCLLIEN
jgi:hypothetical protein